MSDMTHEDRSSDGVSRGRKLLGSLRLRLTLTLILAVLVVTVVSVIIDYRREYRTHMNEVFGSLEEQAQSLIAARSQIEGAEKYALYVNEVCAQMNARISPGHHILVLDHLGNIEVSTQHHRDQAVEAAILGADPAERTLSVEGHRVAQTRTTADDGATVVMAQYLDHVEEVLRKQLLSRALVAGMTAIGIIVLVFFAMNVWVIRHVANLAGAAGSWAARNFAARAPLSGPSELRLLCREFNAMASQLQDHEQRRAAEMEQARQIQMELLPEAVPEIAGLKIVSEYHPAEEVAGDLYDIFQLPSGDTAVAVFDVSGHGITAALLTGLVRMSLRYRTAETGDLVSAIEAINEDILSCVLDNQFVTACLGLWRPSSRTWTYVAAGHPGGIWLTEERVEYLENTGLLLGISREAEWYTKTIVLSPGDRLLLYTDGIIEAGAVDGKALGEIGLGEMLHQSRNQELSEQIRAIVADVVKRSDGEQEDDMTIVGLEVMP